MSYSSHRSYPSYSFSVAPQHGRDERSESSPVTHHASRITYPHLSSSSTTYYPII